MGSNPRVNQEAVINGGGGRGGRGGGGSAKALLHDPGLITQWSIAEQKILEERIDMFLSDPSIKRYTKIAQQLDGKSARDVAQRHMWMIDQERKSAQNLSRKSEGREKVTDPSAELPMRLTGLPIETCDASLYEAIDGATGGLLQRNSELFNKIYLSEICQSIEHPMMLDYNSLFELKENILQIYNNIMRNPSPVSAQMPPFPRKIREMLDAIYMLGNNIPMQRNMN